MSIKIAIVGAGSIGFTRRLVRDILSVPELADTRFAFQDLSQANLDRVVTLCRRDIEENGVPAAIDAGLDRAPALDGADYVINTARVGGLEGFRTDVEIPLKYGVDQCVGDTICAGGLMYGQRTVPMVLELAQQIERYAGADRTLLNYANPMAMNTWAALDHSPIRTIGLCHGVQGGHHLLARLFSRHAGRKVAKDEVDIVAAGINHQTWYVKVLFEGRDWAADLLPLFEADPEIRQREKVRIDIIRRFGYFSTESNGHLSEYLPWYRKRPGEIQDWISTDAWILGETGGYLRVCTENRNWFDTDFPKCSPSRRGSTPRTSAATSTAPTSSKRWKRGACIAATSTCATTARSAISPTTPSSKCRATWTGAAWPSPGSAICRSAARRSSAVPSTCSAWPPRPQSREMSSS